MNGIDYSYRTIHLILARIQYMDYKNVVSVDSWVMKWYTELYVLAGSACVDFSYPNLKVLKVT